MDAVGYKQEEVPPLVFPTLYGLASTGKIKVWSIVATETTNVILSGYMGGKMTPNLRPILGKNTGRANATTCFEQSKLEANARWVKQKDKGYRETIEECQGDTGIHPMRAGYYKDHKGKLIYPCLLQPKLNGIKLVTHRDEEDNLILQSRTGKGFGADLSHISRTLECLDIPYPTDGELYIHGVDLNTISSATKKTNRWTEKLEYWIYDLVIPGEDMETRSAILKSALVDNPHLNIKYCPTFQVVSETEVDILHKDYVESGYEGTIIRQRRGFYKPGPTRSPDCLKNKDFKDDEFLIVGSSEDVHGRIIFRCETYKGGPQFDCVPKGTHEQRIEWAQYPRGFYGKQLTVRYLNLSSYGVPEGNPVGICIRDYE